MTEAKQGWLTSQNTRRRAAFVVALALVGSNLLGFVRNILLARQVPFAVLDSYYAAFRWPDLLFNVIVLGAVATVFQPIFAELKQKDGQAAAYRFTRALLTWLSIGLLAAMAILFMLMPWLMRVTLPYSGASSQVLAVQFGRILLLSPLIFGLANIVGAVLNMEQRFVAYALAPIVYNIAIIVGALSYGRWGNTGLVVSVIVGALCHLGIQLLGAGGLPRLLKPNWQWADAESRRIVGLALPRMLGLGLNQILLIVFTALGSLIGPKSIAIFNLTNDFQTTPTVVVGNTLAVIIFPGLTLAYAAHQKEQFRSLVVRSLELLLFLLVPAATAMYVMRAQLTRLYLALGKSLTWTDTVHAIQALGTFSIGVIFAGIVVVLSRVLYAQHETRRPMTYTGISALISMAAAWLFVVPLHWNVAGLALAYSLGQFINAVLLWLDIRRHSLPPAAERRLLSSALPRTIGTSVVMGLAIWASLRLGALVFGTDTVLGLALQTFVAVLIGTGVFLLAAVLLGSSELSWLFEERAQVMVSRPKELPSPEAGI